MISITNNFHFKTHTQKIAGLFSRAKNIFIMLIITFAFIGWITMEDAIAQRRTPSRSRARSASTFKTPGLANTSKTTKIDNPEVELCLEEKSRILTSNTGDCKYLMPDDIRKSNPTSTFYCVFNIDGGSIDKLTIPNVTSMYLRRYYDIGMFELKATKQDLSTFNFNSNMNIAKDDRVKIGISISYLNTLASGLTKNTLTKSDFIKPLLTQIDISDINVLQNYSDKYSFDIDITQEDVTKCNQSAKLAMQECTKSKFANDLKGMNYSKVKTSCSKYAEDLNNIYKEKAQNMIIRNKAALTNILTSETTSQ